MSDLKQLIADRIAAGSQAQVWTPVDFLDLGSRDAVDKALQRLVSGGQLRLDAGPTPSGFALADIGRLFGMLSPEPWDRLSGEPVSKPEALQTGSFTSQTISTRSRRVVRSKAGTGLEAGKHQDSFTKVTVLNLRSTATALCLATEDQKPRRTEETVDATSRVLHEPSESIPLP
ncbi:MAG TPA: hypothetical protein VMO47_01080 [Rhodothermales bacterium]|nr:hypothetical protein [Rhodothermales bacterium]